MKTNVHILHTADDSRPDPWDQALYQEDSTLGWSDL